MTVVGEATMRDICGFSGREGKVRKEGRVGEVGCIEIKKNLINGYTDNKTEM